MCPGRAHASTTLTRRWIRGRQRAPAGATPSCWAPCAKARPPRTRGSSWTDARSAMPRTCSRRTTMSTPSRARRPTRRWASAAESSTSACSTPRPPWLRPERAAWWPSRRSRTPRSTWRTWGRSYCTPRCCGPSCPTPSACPRTWRRCVYAACRLTFHSREMLHPVLTRNLPSLPLPQILSSLLDLPAPTAAPPSAPSSSSAAASARLAASAAAVYLRILELSDAQMVMLSSWVESAAGAWRAVRGHGQQVRVCEACFLCFPFSRPVTPSHSLPTYLSHPLPPPPPPPVGHVRRGGQGRGLSAA